MKGSVLHVCASSGKGRKSTAPVLQLVRGHGIDGDYHAGTWHRQVSLLAESRIDEMRRKGAAVEPGSFGENVVIDGADPAELPVGQRFRLGGDAILQITQLGKACHTRCAIYYDVGDCIMPSRGVFARVLKSGAVRPGDAFATDESLDVLRFAVLTLSDRGARREREDASGPLAVEMLSRALGGHLVTADVLPDDRGTLERAIVRLADDELCDLVITTGGTGLSPRDVAPEATLTVCDRQVPGMAEAIRNAGLVHTPRAMLSRGVCALRGQTLVVNLSGSPKAVREQLEVILPVLPHALATVTGIPQECAR
jgi:molybdenum cofactor synthesis domain-containing protein